MFSEDLGCMLYVQGMEEHGEISVKISQLDAKGWDGGREVEHGRSKCGTGRDIGIRKPASYVR